MALFGDANVTVDSLMRSEALELFAVSQEKAVRWCRDFRAVLGRAKTLGSMRRLDARSVEIMGSRFEHAIDQVDAVIG